MAKEEGVFLDRLGDEHELISYDPDDAERTQVVAVAQGGRTLEVIVPLLHDDARIGEVVVAGVAGETVFLLGRFDRPSDDLRETSGLLVVAVPHRDGRYRAAIAHATFSPWGSGELTGLGLRPSIGHGDQSVPSPGATGATPGRPQSFDDIRAWSQAHPFRPFLIRTADGEQYPVRRPEEIMIPHEAGFLFLFSTPNIFVQIDLVDIVAVRAIAPDDPETIEPDALAWDGQGIRADLRRLGARIDGVEADANRVSLDLGRAIHKVDLDLGRAIHKVELDLDRAIDKVELDLDRAIDKVDHDLRKVFLEDLLDRTVKLTSLKFLSDFHGWLLGVLVIALFCGLFPALWWSGTIDSKVHRHDRDLKRIEDDSIKRREAVDLRLDELQAAIRRAQEQTTPAR